MCETPAVPSGCTCEWGWENPWRWCIMRSDPACAAHPLDGPAPVIGYLIDGKLWHPSDVTIVRQGAAQAAEGRLPRITVRHHFTPAHAVQATAGNRNEDRLMSCPGPTTEENGEQ